MNSSSRHIRQLVIKRAFDLVMAALGLLLLSPLLVLIALGIKMDGRGPILFYQERVGLGGGLFKIYKFRTMVPASAKGGPLITRGGDPRITRIGRLLRRLKLDELPQLWNVLFGDMSFVGPRPEVPKYVALYDARQRAVLDLKPGITDLASIVFRNEEEILRGAEDSEKAYVDYCLPRKIELNLEYARCATFWRDVLTILQTIFPPLARATVGSEWQEHAVILNVGDAPRSKEAPSSL